MSTQQLKTLLFIIAENPQTHFYMRSNVVDRWKQCAARDVLELICSRSTKFLQCAVKKPNVAQQSLTLIPLPEKSLAINTKYYVATPTVATPTFGTDEGRVEPQVYKGGEHEKKLLDLGLVYLTQRDALTRSAAMLKYTEVPGGVQDEDIMTFYGTEFDPT